MIANLLAFRNSPSSYGLVYDPFASGSIAKRDARLAKIETKQRLIYGVPVPIYVAPTSSSEHPVAKAA